MYKEGAHFDKGKIRFDLLSPYALEELARIVTYGTVKYESRNWEKGMKWGKLFGSTMRHLWRFWSGEDLDPESKLPHLAHAMCCCMFLLDYSKYRREFDDRSKWLNFTNYKRRKL